MKNYICSNPQRAVKEAWRHMNHVIDKGHFDREIEDEYVVNFIRILAANLAELPEARGEAREKC